MPRRSFCSPETALRTEQIMEDLTAAGFKYCQITTIGATRSCKIGSRLVSVRTDSDDAALRAEEIFRRNGMRNVRRTVA